jgi:hypothetical protein
MCQWVGFNLRFGVRLDVLWAVEGIRSPDFSARNRFKSLRKMAGKGEIA